MKQKDFEPLPKDWNGFSQQRRLSLHNSGGILREKDGTDLSHVKLYQPSAFSEIENKEVQIELVKDGDTVKAIKFRCACGCEAEVEFEIENEALPADQPVDKK